MDPLTPVVYDDPYAEPYDSIACDDGPDNPPTPTPTEPDTLPG